MSASSRVRVLSLLAMMLGAAFAHADSPELSMRDFASSQIKKGARTLGLGGDGATWGNYGLVWHDAGTALVDYGDTAFSNGNDFHFFALGATTPTFWDDVAVYLIAMREESNTVRFRLKAPGLGTAATDVAGQGVDNALFSKVAMPLGHDVSAGLMFAWEHSHFDAAAVSTPASTARYETVWRPSGGAGLTWQPDARLLVGLRTIFNNDLERRIDSTGVKEGLSRSFELRLGVSASLWPGALIDVGGTRLEKRNSIASSHSEHVEPNIGFEQAFLARRLVLRFGVDESSPTAGFSVKFHPVAFDVAYVRNLSRARVGEYFGTQSDTVIATLSLDYKALYERH
jgi:hypothetical protein